MFYINQINLLIRTLKILRLRLFYPPGVFSNLYRTISNNYIGLHLKKLFNLNSIQLENKSEIESRKCTRIENKFFILHYKGAEAGLCALLKMVLLTLDKIDYVHNNVYIDFNKYPVEFTNLRKWMNKYNAWEYFFLQPNNKVVYIKSNLLIPIDIRENFSQHHLGGKVKSFIDNESELARLKGLFAKVVLPNELVLEYVSELKKEIEFRSSDTLGVIFRGIPHYSKDHPIIFSPSEIVSSINSFSASEYCPRLLLSSHSLEAKNHIRNELARDFLIYPEFRFKSQSPLALKIKKKLKLQNGRPLNQLDYLAELVLLGQCKFFLGETGNATDIAILGSIVGQKRKIISKGFIL